MAKGTSKTRGKGNKTNTKAPRKAAAEEEEEDEGGGTATATESDELDLEEGEDAEDTDTEVDADEEAEHEADAEADEDAEPVAKPSKGKRKPQPEAEPADEAEDEETFEISEGFGVIDLPVDDLKLNKVRTPSDEAIAAMVKSIRANGLLNPIIVTTDKYVVAGNTRLLAYRQMKKKTIPCRIATDKDGNQIDHEAAATAYQMIAEQLGRTDLTAAETAKACEAAMKQGLAESIKDLAAKLGLPQGKLQRSVSIYTKGTKALTSLLESDGITEAAAEKLVARCSSPAELDKALAAIVKASDGKVTDGAVNKAVPSRRAGRHGKAGRKPSIAGLSGETLKTEETGLSGNLRMIGKDDFVVEVRVAIPTGTVKTFSRFEIAKKVQAAMSQIDIADWRRELEAARARLTE